MAGSRVAVIAVMAALAVVLYAIDIAMPPGVLDGIGYPSLMLFTLWLPGRRPVIAAAAAFTVLTVAAYTQLQPGGIGDANIANRVFALVLVWLVAGLLLQRKAADQRLREAEGAHIIEEGIAQRAGDIDVTYVNGYGFPRYRGGPMFHAALTGWPKVIAFVKAQAAGPFGKWWTPSAWLLRQN